MQKTLRKMISNLGVATVCGISLVLALSGEATAIPSTQFTVTGQVVNPGTFTLSDLTSFTPTTVNVGADAYTGVSLWTLLNNVGIVTNPQVKNDILRNYVLATGNDGYAVLFSLGEIDPLFGNQPDLIAYEQNGNPLGNSGFARIVVPGDNKRGRWVSNLVSLQVFNAGGPPTGSNHPYSTEFTLSGQVNSPGNFTSSDLPGSMAPVTITVGSTPLAGSSFTGVPLWTLLSNAGIETDPNMKNDELRKFVVATASDGYQAVFSLGELDPNFGGHQPPDLVAYADENGNPLTADGFARIVVPGDNRAGRYVSNLVSLEVRGVAVPEPGTGVLLITGLIALGLGGAWRTRSTGAMALPRRLS